MLETCILSCIIILKYLHFDHFFHPEIRVDSRPYMSGPRHLHRVCCSMVHTLAACIGTGAPERTARVLWRRRPRARAGSSRLGGLPPSWLTRVCCCPCLEFLFYLCACGRANGSVWEGTPWYPRFLYSCLLPETCYHQDFDPQPGPFGRVPYSASDLGV